MVKLVPQFKVEQRTVTVGTTDQYLGYYYAPATFSGQVITAFVAFATDNRIALCMQTATNEVRVHVPTNVAPNATQVTVTALVTTS